MFKQLRRFVTYLNEASIVISMYIFFFIVVPAVILGGIYAGWQGGKRADECRNRDANQAVHIYDRKAIGGGWLSSGGWVACWYYCNSIEMDHTMNTIHLSSCYHWCSGDPACSEYVGNVTILDPIDWVIAKQP